MPILALWSEEDLESVISGAQIDPVRKDCGDVGQTQLALHQQGYYDGPLTGAYNDEMGEAMQAFLQDQGLPPSASGQDFCVALRNAQIKLSSDARSELNSRIAGFSPLVILGALAVAGAAWWKWGRGHGYTPNKTEPAQHYASPEVYSPKRRPRYKGKFYETKSEARSAGREFASRLKKAGVGVVGKPRVDVIEGHDGGYFWSVAFKRMTTYGRDESRSKIAQDNKRLRKIVNMRGKGYNRIKVSS